MTARIPRPRPDLDGHMKSKILSVLSRKGEALTSRQLAQYVSGLTRENAEIYLEQLASSGNVMVETGQRVNRYFLPEVAIDKTHDEFDKFVHHCCQEGTSLSAESTILYDAYKHWCERGKIRTRTQAWFGRQALLRYEKGRQPNGRYCYYGVAIKGQEVLNSNARIAPVMAASSAVVSSSDLRAVINAVLDEREKRDPTLLTQRSAISAWLDALLAARDGGDLEATVDRVIEEMQELIF